MSLLFLVIIFYVVVYERKKSSITMAIVSLPLLIIHIMLLMSTLGIGYDIFAILFRFHFQYANYQATNISGRMSIFVFSVVFFSVQN